MYRTFALLVTSICLSSFIHFTSEAEEPQYSSWSTQDWQIAARNSVLEAFRQYIQNHPGVYDLDNPEFVAQLAIAREQGLDAADKATDRIGYAKTLATFSAVLQDGHALVFDPSATARGGEAVWPGFVALWRGEWLYARTTDPTDPINAARIMACDGTPIREFLLDRLLLFNFRPGEAGQWWARPSQLFYASSGQGDVHPERCTFAMKSGEEITLQIDWKPLTEAESIFRRQAVYGDREPIALQEPREKIFFIGLQDFQPDENGVLAYQALFDEVKARRGELLNSKAVVLDMRRNNGGNSRWSERLAKLLWGEAALEGRYEQSTDVLWRSSPGNITHMENVAERLSAQGDTSTAEWVDRLTDGMQASLNLGEPYFKESELDQLTAEVSSQEKAPQRVSDFTAPVYVITPGYCASACLDALDFFTLFENVKIIGAPTSADSTYMDVRVADLASGPGKIVIPVKVYIGRKRDWGEIYEPHIMMTDLDWSSENFLDWIERDLPAR